MPYIIYADIEFLLRKIDGHIPCGYSVLTV